MVQINDPTEHIDEFFIEFMSNYSVKLFGERKYKK